MITGYGVAEAVKHYYNIWGGDFVGKRAIIQGWGNVGAAAAVYLANMGVKIVGIIDRVGGLLNPEGLSFDEVKTLFVNKQGNKLVADNLVPFDEANEKIWSLGAEVFIPAAASRLVTKAQVEQMIAAGLEVVSAGANVPFADEEIFFGPISDFADNQVAIIPDFIANCGMARVFGYLMSGEVELSDEGIFSDTSEVIREALAKVHAVHADKKNIAKAAFKIALEQLV
jgi:glutamate dehydrogenase/leucine dehydrogenase